MLKSFHNRYLYSVLLFQQSPAHRLLVQCFFLQFHFQLCFFLFFFFLASLLRLFVSSFQFFAIFALRTRFALSNDEKFKKFRFGTRSMKCLWHFKVLHSRVHTFKTSYITEYAEPKNHFTHDQDIFWMLIPSNTFKSLAESLLLRPKNIAMSIKWKSLYFVLKFLNRIPRFMICLNFNWMKGISLRIT